MITICSIDRTIATYNSNHVYTHGNTPHDLIAISTVYPWGCRVDLLQDTSPILVKQNNRDTIFPCMAVCDMQTEYTLI